jgi:hypothetical protein
MARTTAGPPTTLVSPTVSIAGVYFGLQASGGVLLWIAAASIPTVRDWLELVPAVPGVTDAFAVADLAVAVVASAVTCAALLTGRRWGAATATLTAGAIIYPTVYLIGWVAAGHDTGTEALAIMLPTALLCSWAARQAWRLT